MVKTFEELTDEFKEIKDELSEEEFSDKVTASYVDRINNTLIELSKRLELLSERLDVATEAIEAGKKKGLFR